MQLTVELDDSLGWALKKDAEASGQSAEQYLESLIKREVRTRDFTDTELREKRVDEALEKLCLSGATSGRDGRPWREYIHEGHRY